MPTYAYRCEREHEFELFHSIKDDAPRTCPTCGAPARRVPAGGAGLLFKGSGFYITDYRSSSYREKAKSEKPAPADKPATGGGSGAAGGPATGGSTPAGGGSGPGSK